MKYILRQAFAFSFFSRHRQTSSYWGDYTTPPRIGISKSSSWSHNECSSIKKVFEVAEWSEVWVGRSVVSLDFHEI